VSKHFNIVFLFLFINTFAQKDFKILSSTNSALVVEYEALLLDTSFVTINNQQYLKIILHNGSNYSDEVGYPQIPVRIFNIGVTSEFGNNIRVISSKYDVIHAKVKPNPNMRKSNNLPYYEYLENDNYRNFSNPELVSFGDFGLVRDLSVQSINVHPIQFDPAKNEIKIYSKIIFQISFGSRSSLYEISKSDLTRDIVINPKTAKMWGNVLKLNKKGTIKNSVLANGNWYKFEAPEEGIYKIDRSFLESLGIDLTSVDPRTIKIYNNGGSILPWSQSASRPTDLVENAIIVDGENDGMFDTNDNILFYGRGVDFWEYNNGLNKISRNKHFYSKQNYYWLTFGGEVGKRMETQPNLDSTPDFIQNTTIAFKSRDNDNQNLIGSGLLYVDDDYSSVSKSKTYTNTLNELLPNSTINYTFQFVNGSLVSNLLTIDENNNRIFSRNIAGPSQVWIDYRYGALTRSFESFTGTLPENRSVLKFTYNPSSISDKGHLDLHQQSLHLNSLLH